MAIKILKEGVSNELRADFEREVEILSNFQHPNIVKLIGVTNEEPTPSMVFEYMALGDLTEILRKCDTKKLRNKQQQQQQSENNQMTNILGSTKSLAGATTTLIMDSGSSGSTRTTLSLMNHEISNPDSIEIKPLYEVRIIFIS